MLKVLTATIAVAALSFGFSSPARAMTSDQRTRFTFSQPVSLPGVTLPAGTYVFRLADPTTDRKVVQVMDEAGKHSLALLNAIPSYRADAVGEPTVSLVSTVAGMPTALKTWWPQGENTGFEFVFPEEQWMKLTGLMPAGSDQPTQLAAAEPPAAASRGRRLMRQVAALEPAVLPQVSVINGPGAPNEPLGGSAAAMIAILGAITLFGGAWALSQAKV